MWLGKIGLVHLQGVAPPHPCFSLNKKRLASQATAIAMAVRMIAVSNICSMGAKPFDFG